MEDRQTEWQGVIHFQKMNTCIVATELHTFVGGHLITHAGKSEKQDYVLTDKC